MYKQIDLGKMYLLIDFLCFISSNKVHPKPRNSIIALSNMKTFKNFKKSNQRKLNENKIFFNSPCFDEFSDKLITSECL